MTPDADDELYDKFLGTTEMEAWDAFMTAARKAIEEGADEAMLPTEFLALIMPDLNAPTDFAAVRSAWNRLCDAEKRPELKKPEPAPIDNDVSDDEPF